MNIGIDIRCLMVKNRTGVGEYTFELLNAVFNIDQKNQYFLFYNSYGDVSKNIPLWNRPNVHYVVKRWPNKILNGALKFLNYPKLDHITSKKLDFWFSPNLYFTALTPNIKHILTVHDLSFDIFPRFYTTKQHLVNDAKKQCERANIILTPSENTKRDIVDYYKIDANKIRVIYPGTLAFPPYQGGTQRGLPSSAYTNEVVTKDGQPPMAPLGKGGEPTFLEKVFLIKRKYNLPEKFILFLGTIEPRKNIVGLIEAFEILQMSLSTFNFQLSTLSLVIAGAPGWKNKKIYERANKSPVRDKIKFIGFINPEEKAALYAAASLFVYPSFYEGFGFPVLEAMTAGTPVITSNRSSLPEITGSAAYLVNPNKPQEIAEGMNWLLNNKTLREAQIKNGLEQAKKFSWENAANEFLAVILSEAKDPFSR